MAVKKTTKAKPKRRINSYKTGRDFEYKIRDYLKERGWIVKRAYASKGIFDLLAWKDEMRWGKGMI